MKGKQKERSNVNEVKKTTLKSLMLRRMEMVKVEGERGWEREKGRGRERGERGRGRECGRL